jgi:hypothetical protein
LLKIVPEGLGLAINEQVLTSIEVEVELAVDQLKSPAVWLSWIGHDAVIGPHHRLALMVGLPFGQGDDVVRFAHVDHVVIGFELLSCGLVDWCNAGVAFDLGLRPCAKKCRPPTPGAQTWANARGQRTSANFVKNSKVWAYPAHHDDREG